jgi:hypothetical protein
VIGFHQKIPIHITSARLASIHGVLGACCDGIGGEIKGVIKPEEVQSSTKPVVIDDERLPVPVGEIWEVGDGGRACHAIKVIKVNVARESGHIGGIYVSERLFESKEGSTCAMAGGNEVDVPKSPPIEGDDGCVARTLDGLGDVAGHDEEVDEVGEEGDEVDVEDDYPNVERLHPDGRAKVG